ncbi:TasA family protein [Halobacillus sp. MO56]
MKNIKKALVGTALAGTLVVGAGAGTYSWFNAEYTASGEITNETLQLNGETTFDEKLFEGATLAPSRTVEDSFSIKNTGSMDQIVRGKLDLAIYDGNQLVSLDKGEYEVDVLAKYNGTTVVNQTFSAEDIDTFFKDGEWLPDDTGHEGNYFVPGAEVTFDLGVRLKSSAGNEYQGKKLVGSIEVDARQTEAASTFND